MSNLDITPDVFLRLYYKQHPQGPRITIYDRSDTTSWKGFIPLLVQLENGDLRVGHANYVHYQLLAEDADGRPGDH